MNEQKPDELIPEGGIVVLGNFNPAIFHPEWFRSYKILPEQEIVAAENERILLEHRGVRIKGHQFVVTPQETDLLFQSFVLNVTPEKFQLIGRPGSGFDLVKDTAIKVFRLLSHTPLKAVGFNFNAHWKMAEEGKVFLKNLFPVGPKKVDVIGKDYSVGGSLKFQHNNAEVTFRIEESPLFDSAIFFAFNFHREILNHRAETLIDLVRSTFDEDLVFSQKITINFLGKPESVCIQNEESSEHENN